MEWGTLITVVSSSVGVSAATAAWLTRSLIGHRLSKDLETFKAELAREQARDKAAAEGVVRQQVETLLGDKAAERHYALDARKRLYTAIGPLRFQLLLACRDLAGRVQTGTTRVYDLDIAGYYGRSTLYRILRPLCLSELIERQIAFADFSVDSGAIDLLRFKKGAYATFSGGSVVNGHPEIDWNNQREHVFFDSLSRCVNSMILHESNGAERVLRFHEFDSLLDDDKRREEFEPFPTILHDLTPQKKALFWTRLIAYGCLCNQFINKAGISIGFEQRPYPVAELLLATADVYIASHIDAFVQRCEAVIDSPL